MPFLQRAPHVRRLAWAAAIAVAGGGCDNWVVNDYRGRLTRDPEHTPLVGAKVVLGFPGRLEDVERAEAEQSLRNPSLSTTDRDGRFRHRFHGPMTSAIAPPTPAMIHRMLLWVEIAGGWHLYEVPVAAADQEVRPGSISVTLPDVTVAGTDASVRGHRIRQASYVVPTTQATPADLCPAPPTR